MLIVFLSDSGGRVEIPDAVDCVDGASEDVVEFLDASGHCLVRFRRQDVTMFTKPENLGADGLHSNRSDPGGVDANGLVADEPVG